MNTSYEEHPFPSFYNGETEYLIVGSFPPIKLTKKVYSDDELKGKYESYLKNNLFNKEKDIDFYYGSSDNYFWPILRTLYKEELSNATEIKSFLESKNIGITDLFEKCKRKIKGNKIDSSDSSLCILEKRDLRLIFNECKKLKKVYLTSKWVYKKFIESYPGVNYELIILESPSGQFDRSIGKIDEYKRLKSENGGYNAFSYRLDKYSAKLPI